MNARRPAAVPALTYPAELPVCARRDEIVAAIRDHQVVVVAGETGSGKTTQLPKMCLELGRGVDAMIGHTQPRRIAARAVAERLADELGVAVGGAVGYAVRFDDRVGPETLVKVMTDGLLLAEIRRDRKLSAYDTVIVDEAHERSLNVDFLLGYLTTLLPRRPDLKVIITSATIDTQRFAAHFGAPVVEVSGRTWPVEIRYRPPGEDDGGGAAYDDDGDDGGRGGDIDINQAICDAVVELAAIGPGDILVFLPGERDIRDAADALRQHGPEGLEILPLYARLATADQHRVFRPHRGRRVVLATNVAETSLTVPGIRFVVDTGLARVSRFNHRSKVQRLPIEAISRASADQRAGRCGRLGPGTCIRLYSEADFAARPEFTDPEIVRTNLASVILSMAAIGLGEVEDFPFLDPPDRRSVADGRALLEELGAFAPGETTRLTKVGRQLAELPLDPRLGRMVVEAERRGCLREVVVIAAALSIQDPREYPAERSAEAAELHRRFEDPHSDFTGLLRLWDYLTGLQDELSGNGFRRRCRAELLHVLRVREWQDLVGQIRQSLRAQRSAFNHQPADAEQVHRAILSGLLSHIGVRDRERGDYLGARNTRWSIGRSSTLARRPPAWAMAGELVETDRTWARRVARIEPSWAEQAGAHLLQRRWSEPWWDPQRGEARVEERAFLYGLPVVAPRSVALQRIDPEAARRWFIDEALVARNWDAEFPPHSLTARREAMVASLEQRLRRADLLAGPEVRAAFFAAELPAEICGGPALMKWWRRQGRADPERLAVPLAVLLDRRGGPVELSDYPDRWRQGDVVLDLRYRYEPGAEDDGVTVLIPLDLLNQVSSEGFDWNIPGYRLELVSALVRSLPKPLRRELGPTGAVAAAILDGLDPSLGRLRDAAAGRLSRLAGQAVDPRVWDGIELPAHLHMHFAITDRGQVVAAGADLDALRRRLRSQMLESLRRCFPGWPRGGATTWDWGDIPEVLEAPGEDSNYRRAWPGLIEEDPARPAGRRAEPVPAPAPEGSVGLVLWDSAAARDAALWPAVRRLIRRRVPVPTAHVEARIAKTAKLAIVGAGRRLDDVVADCADAVVDQMITARGGPPRAQAVFDELAADAGAHLVDRVVRLSAIAGAVLGAAGQVLGAVDRLDDRYRSASHRRASTDIRRQVETLVAPGFVSLAGPGRLRDLLRYLDAAARRVERLPGDAPRDAQRQAVVDRLQARLDLLADRLSMGTAGPGAATTAAAVRWMIEELRVSLWAQQLGTPMPVSEERISRRLAEVGG